MTLAKKDLSRHPCFNKAAAGSCGRVHLPVAPKCNIKCNYCDRKYDCVNESRPGVSSAVLKPRQALAYMEKVLEKEPRITVAGIAGPGDPFANPAETLETMRLLREAHPGLLFCLSSNGLAVPDYVDDIAELDVSHVTITMNAVDVEIGAEVYGWVRDGNVVYRGVQAAEVLLERQLTSIRELKKRGVMVKVNTIVMPGINDHHVEEVARTARELGVDLHNLIPLYPNANTPFGKLEEPSKELMRDLRAKAEQHTPQMRHCKRCRADAVGLLCHDRSSELGGDLRACASLKPKSDEEERPYVAVATREGMLVNLHLGEANTFQIWGERGEGLSGGFRLIEERRAPKAGCGPKRWDRLGVTLSDCRAVLAGAMGETPQKALAASGVKPYVCSGFIEDALAAVYGRGDMSIFQARKNGVACGGCSGSGEGC